MIDRWNTNTKGLIQPLCAQIKRSALPLGALFADETSLREEALVSAVDGARLRRT